MKKLNSIPFITLMILLFISCKKEDTIVNNAGSVNITNAVVGGVTLSLLTDPSYVSLGNNRVSLNNFALVPLAVGHTQVILGNPAVAATATTAAVPAIPYFTTTLEVDKITNYSLFLTGSSISTIESVVVKEKPIATYKDSICAVRFINLSPGSTPISVNIKGQPNGTEVNSLAYKVYTDFKEYPAKKINSSYVFEFRNASTGSVISTYTLNTPYFNHVTLALRGLASGPNGVILINNYYN